MATTYDLDMSGLNGVPNPEKPVDGTDGLPLGPSGNGAPGQGSKYTCDQDAGPGLSGNAGLQAPGAKNGANGNDAYTVTITCAAFSGAGLTLLKSGGDGAVGNDGGKGGTGSAGGNAGKQPAGCKQVISGGIGGAAGKGGAAGSGGKAGNGGNVNVVYGPGIASLPVAPTGVGGIGGLPGKYGAPGTPGKGGLDSDGTPNLSGATGSYGAQGGLGKGGKSGSFTSTQDPKQGSSYLMISVQTNVST